MNQRRTPPITTVPSRRAAPRARGARRGSAYVMVMGVATLVAVIGAGALLTARVNTRVTAGGNDAVEADVLATSAIDQALTLINTDPNWRSRYSSGAEIGPYKLGRGAISWKFVDEYDGNLADDPAQLVRLYGTASVGRATRVYSVQLGPTGPGLDVLKKAAHGDGAFTVRTSNVTITAAGGPLSTDGVFTADGSINADVETGKSVSGSNSSVKGSISTGVAPRQMPSPSVFDLYLPRATEIPWQAVASGGIKGVLSAGSNPFGTPNAEGIYHVRVPPAATLKINNARLVATLLVTGDQGAHVTAGAALLWETPRPDMPALIARGPDLHVTLDSASLGVSETTAGHNLNPPSTPYNGGSDNDVLDILPAEIRGLVHVAGPGGMIEIGSSLVLKGLLLTDGSIVTGDTSLLSSINAKLTADPGLYAEPPEGYTTGEQMAPVFGTFERRTSPERSAAVGG